MDIRAFSFFLHCQCGKPIHFDRIQFCEDFSMVFMGYCPACKKKVTSELSDSEREKMFTRFVTPATFNNPDDTIELHGLGAKLPDDEEAA